MFDNIGDGWATFRLGNIQTPMVSWIEDTPLLMMEAATAALLGRLPAQVMLDFEGNRSPIVITASGLSFEDSFFPWNDNYGIYEFAIELRDEMNNQKDIWLSEWYGFGDENQELTETGRLAEIFDSDLAKLSEAVNV